MKAKFIKEGIKYDPDHNYWLINLKDDLIQHRYNLTVNGLYNGILKESIENVLLVLKEDYDIPGISIKK